MLVTGRTGSSDRREDRPDSSGRPDLSGWPTVTGYRRPSGRIGIRNRLLILPSVICSQQVADRIAEAVPGAVGAPHDHGCGQLGADAAQTERTFVGVGTNPNVAGTVVVGLGCETIGSEGVAAALADASAPVRELSIQGIGGTDATIERGIEIATELRSTVRDDRTSADLGDLTIGIVSSDLRASTIERGEPLVGILVDRIVDAGGRVLVVDVERLVPHATEAVGLTTDDETADDLEATVEQHRTLPPRRTGTRARARERSFDELSQLWAGRPIREVVSYGGSPTVDAGVVLVDAPGGFAEAATGLAAAGAHLIVHATADGISTGHPIVPVVTVTGSEETYEALKSDIDVYANGSASTSSPLLETVQRVLDGESTRSERHGLSEFAITRVGPSM